MMISMSAEKHLICLHDKKVLIKLGIDRENDNNKDQQTGEIAQWFPAHTWWLKTACKNSLRDT